MPRSAHGWHWLRDTVYREDHSSARTRSGPRVMAALRDFAIGAFHLLGRRDITAATGWTTRAMDRPFNTTVRVCRRVTVVGLKVTGCSPGSAWTDQPSVT